MAPKEVIEHLRQTEHTFCKVGVVDTDGVLRSKLLHVDKLLSVLEKGFGFCNVVFGWDSADVAYENNQLVGWQTGYPDLTARVDTSTLRSIPWDMGRPFLLADFHATDFPACPRSLLRRILDQVAEAGYTARIGLEYEWFNFRESPRSWADKGYRDPQPITPGMFGYSSLRFQQESDYVRDLHTQLQAFGVPLEGLHTETGPGVYEAAIQVSEGLEAADRAVCFKDGVKAIAHRHGFMASFMAKWRADLPGCSGHLHQSLDKDGQNAFADPRAADGMSALMRHYLAGQLHCLPYILPLYAPTVNSYKRLVEGAWAPTTLTWGHDNRTVAVRALTAQPGTTRLELRVGGSDANPYLLTAAALASGLYGIRHQLPLEQPATVGNGYQDRQVILPRDLGEAIRQMKASPLPRELFGDAFVNFFLETREWEWQQYQQAVTNWELRRYFEII
ncbi:MAG: glutamine synthetase [Lewinella sp.]|nr:glutamine synthetase [Lewinella sp.]